MLHSTNAMLQSTDAMLHSSDTMLQSIDAMLESHIVMLQGSHAMLLCFDAMLHCSGGIFIREIGIFIDAHPDLRSTNVMLILQAGDYFCNGKHTHDNDHRSRFNELSGKSGNSYMATFSRLTSRQTYCVCPGRITRSPRPSEY